MVNGAALRLLVCYLKTNALSFTELCEQADYPTDLGGYYIRRLVAAKCLVKTARGQYEITPSGKQQLITYMSGNGNAPITRSRLCALVVVRQAEKYIVVRRRYQPFIGYAEWPATSVKLGEDLPSAVERVLHDKLEIAPCSSTFVGFFRRVDVYGTIVFDDKIFAVHTCDLPANVTIAESTEFGTILQLSRQEVLSLDRPSRALHDILAFAQASAPYAVKHYTLSLDDLNQ